MKKWESNLICDICKKDVREIGEVFYDSKTIIGSWALLCITCWFKVGIGVLGLGRGQKYDSKTLEKLEG